MKKRLKILKGTENHEKIKMKQQKAKILKRTNVRSKENRIKVFKNLIREGPMYICVCCNRCLYKKSVINFSEDKYNFLDHILQNEIVQSFDGQIYICFTCHKKMLKK